MLGHPSVQPLPARPGCARRGDLAQPSPTICSESRSAVRRVTSSDSDGVEDRRQFVSSRRRVGQQHPGRDSPCPEPGPSPTRSSPIPQRYAVGVGLWHEGSGWLARPVSARPPAEGVWGAAVPGGCSRRTKSATVRVSPRRAGSMLADSSREADRYPIRPTPGKRCAPSLRRWANAMSARSKTCWRKASSWGPTWSRGDRHAPDRDTPGNRPEHRRRHHPAAADGAERARIASHAGTPYSPCHRAPRPAARRPRTAPSPWPSGWSGTREQVE